MKARFAILGAAAALCLSGCEDPGDWGSCDWPWEHHHSSSDSPAATATAEESHAEPTAPSTPAAESAAAGRLAFRFGGFDGSLAAEEPAAQISSLRMSRSGMSYKWTAGGCETLGATSRTDCGRTLACAFYWDEREGAWIGGKFDWVSTSRTSRDFKNIHDRYHGWDPDAFFAAKKRAFCVVSKDGRTRTNLIETKEP